MRAKTWWIKERFNPQLGYYYVPMGILPKREAKRHETTIYGDNRMLPFESEQAYLAHLSSLRAEGKNVRDAR